MDSRSTSPVRAEPNVTPMIDVMLVLLIIFLISVPMIVQGFRAEPPRSTTLELRPEAEHDITIGIDRAGGFYLDGAAVAREELGSRLQMLMNARSGNPAVLLRADGRIEYDLVLRVISETVQNGVHSIGLITERRPESRIAR